MDTAFIILENGSIIRKSYVNMIHKARNTDASLYRVEVHYSGGVITFHYCDEEDAYKELKRLTSKLLEKE